MEYCKLCEKAVGSKERRLLTSVSSERVLRCLQELQAASGSTATLLGDEHAQRAFVCRPCFAETEKYLRLSEEVERVRNSLCEKLFRIEQEDLPSPRVDVDSASTGLGKRQVCTSIKYNTYSAC